jgi:hypothetical protein
MSTPPLQATTKVLLSLGLVASLSLSLQAQTIDDAIMLGGRELQTGNHYSYDRWNQYWEGTVRRTNGNIGRITTKANVWTANYGLADRLNVIALVPYVWTHASQGVLHGIEGFQDLTLAAKWNFLDRPWTDGSLRAFLVVSGGFPMTDYNPELLPLSIGMGSTRVSWRGTLNFQSNPGWFLTSTTAFTWRSQVGLDRPYFFTDGEFVMSDQVDMPNVIDTTASAGYNKRGLMTSVSFSNQQTLSGGDIRRQDMPFVSNKMDFFRVGAMVMYPVPKLQSLAVEFAVAHTLDGRNVGEATTFTTGLLYTFNGRPAK